MEKSISSANALPMSEQSGEEATDVRLRPRATVARAQFAGRIGGNQEFIADPASHDAQSLLQKQPDAAPLSSLSTALDLKGFLDHDLWRMAVIEGWGTFLLISLVGAMASGLTSAGQTAFASTLYASLANFYALSLFTYCLAPITGAHMNPAISMGTFFAGLSTFPRTVLYIMAQVTGATVAGFWLKLGLGDAFFPHDVIPGCTVDAELVSPGQLFALEYVFSQAMIFVAFGVGLDPRQGKAIGPSYAPLLVGFVVGLGGLCSSLARPGYTGVSFNPARCLGLMAAKSEMQYHYVHWLGPLAATLLNAIFYHFCPPWSREQPLFAAVFGRHRKHR